MAPVSMSYFTGLIRFRVQGMYSYMRRAQSQRGFWVPCIYFATLLAVLYGTFGYGFWI